MERLGRIKKTIWISFDLGLNGDYENPYFWLDSHEVKERVGNLAVFNFHYLRTPNKDLISQLMKDLKKHVRFSKSDRVYAIYKDDQTSMIKGKFIVGSRKASPWAGYAVRDAGDDVATES